MENCIKFFHNTKYFIDQFNICLKDFNHVQIEDKVEKRVQKNILLSLENGLQGNYDYQKELINRWQEIPSRFRKMKAPIRVSIDNITSTNFSLIEVNCKNSPGILYVITKTLAEQGVQINSASISTYGHRVMDIFYVKDLFGQKNYLSGKWLVYNTLEGLRWRRFRKSLYPKSFPVI